MNDLVYIIDRIEHGNGGVCDMKVLDELDLTDALKKRPSQYGVYSKVFDFWPIISRRECEINDPWVLYYWDNDEKRWEKWD